MTVSGFLREDVDPANAQTPGGDISGVDSTFTDWVHSILIKQLGAKLASLAPDQYNALVLQLWQDPAIADAWTQYNAPFDPANPTAYIPSGAQMQTLISDALTSTTGKSDNPDLVQSFLATKADLGVTLSPAERSYNAQSYTTVPPPFAQVPISGYKYGDTFPSDLPHWSGTDKHMGTDYGTPAGTPIVAPFAGTVTYETGQQGYGNLLVLTMPDGSQLRFGHVGADTLTGPVNPGEQIGVSGENVGDSTGAVTLVEYKNAQGQYQDPASILDPIWKGTSFEAMGFGGAAGQGLTAEQVALRRFGIYDPQLAIAFSPEVNLFKQYFGRDPTTAELQSITSGGKDVQQMEDLIRGLPSHIAGISIGNFTDLKSQLDPAFLKVYGHVGNDTNLKEVWDQSKGSPSGSFIQYYLDQLGMQPGRHIDPFVYNSVYQAALPQSMAFTNQQPDVRDLKAIWQQAGSPGEVKPSEANAVAASSPALTVLPGAQPQEQQAK